MPRKRSVPPPLSVNDALRDKSKGKVAPVKRDEWLAKYEVQLGIKPGSKTSSGQVLDAICKFCITYGREEAPVDAVQDPSQLSAVLAEKKRKKTTRPAVFTAFRKDNLMKHIRQQHPSRWLEYDSLPLDEKIRQDYFGRDRKIIPFLPSQPSFSFVVPFGVITTIKRLNFDDGATPIDDAFDEQEDGSSVITVSNRDQFETILECVSGSISYRGTVNAFIVFGKRLMNMKLGIPTEKQIRQAVRMAAAVNLTVFGELIRRSWGFSIMVDGATHLSLGYLDVRLSFALGGTVQNFHFLAIPAGALSHTGRNYADLVIAALTDIAGQDALMKLIGMATDGAANMLGCRRGFVKLVREACTLAGGGDVVANWCGSHQLNLAVGSFLAVFDDFVGFRSVNTHA